MTYLVGAPNTNQSPGEFPAQGNENFSRLKTIIDADHVFNDSTAVNDGAHRQMTMVNRTDPSGVPAVGTNGIIYNKAVGTTNSPFFWDGTTVVGVPIPQLAQGFTGTTAIDAVAVNIFPDPGYQYTGFVSFQSQDTGTSKAYVVSRTSYGNSTANLTSGSGAALSYSGNNLQASTVTGATNLKWTLQIIRLS